jgi:hypothetical protein
MANLRPLFTYTGRVFPIRITPEPLTSKHKRQHAPCDNAPYDWLDVGKSESKWFWFNYYSCSTPHRSSRLHVGGDLIVNSPAGVPL